MVNRGLLIKLAVVAVVLIGAGLLLACGHDLKALVQHALQWLRTAGPVTFFLAMALLPAIGAPLSFFSLTAGPLFAPQIGMPLTTTLSLAAIAVNITIGYVLANKVLRPPLEYLMQRLGYRLPQVRPGEVNDLVVLLRVTPGLPFPVQNYLLGIAAVPFVRYLLISCIVAFPFNVAIILFGDALLRGQGGMALIGLMLLLAVIAAIHLVRKHYGARKNSLSSPAP